MKGKGKLIKKFIIYCFTILFLGFISAVWLQAQDQKKSTSETSNKPSDKQLKDSTEKKKVYDQIKKDIEKLSLEECIDYIDWNPLIDKDFPDSSIFAIEIILKKWGEKAEKYPYFFGRLGNEYLMKEELTKSDEMFQKLYLLDNGVPKKKWKDNKSLRDAKLYSMGQIFQGDNIKAEQYSYEKASLFIKENPDATLKQREKAEKIIISYERIQKEKEEFENRQKVVIQLAQKFLDDLAQFINDKDLNGMTLYFYQNTSTERWATSYIEAFQRHFFPFKHIVFKVTGAVPFGDADNWQFFYTWITEPEDLTPVEDRESSMTILINNHTLTLIE